MTDLFKLLPPLYWRGVGPLPVAERRVRFDQELARHKFMYRDDELIEATGRKNWEFEYKLAFYEDIGPGRNGYKSLYLETFRKFIEACRDRSEGQLQDPMLGVFTARCETVEIETDINKRDGEAVVVKFIHSPTAEYTESLSKPLVKLQPSQEAKSLNTEVQAIRIPTKPSPEAIAKFAIIKPQLEDAQKTLPTLVDALDFVSGLGRRGEAYLNQVEAAVDDVSFKLSKVSDLLIDFDKAALNPQNAPIVRGIRRLRDTAEQFKHTVVAPGRAVGSRFVGQDTPIFVFVSESKMTITEFKTLNPALTGPYITAGTTVSCFVDKP